MSRPLSTRAVLFDPRESLALRPIREALREVADPRELAAASDSYYVVHRGGERVRHEAIISAASDAGVRFAVDTETSESFLAALDDALVVGRGLVITRHNEVIREMLAIPIQKYGATDRKGRLAFRPGRYSMDIARRVKSWDESALLMAGPTDGSYGDWIWKFPPRLTIARAAGLDLPVVISSRLPDRYIEMLELLGIDRSRLIVHHPKGISVFRRLFVPSWPTIDRLRPMKGWAAVYRPLAEQGQRWWQADHGAARPRLYLARTHIRAHVLTNEAEVIDLFRGRGFHILQPETMSWRDVLSAFSCASVVAGPYGSALRNLAFCAAQPLAFVLMPPCDETFLRGSALWMAELGARVAFVQGEAAPLETGGDPRRAPWTVDLASTARTLDRLLEAGLARC